MGRIRVLVVDDHRIFAEALAAALAAEPDVEVGAAGSATAAERALERAAAEGRAFDIVLIDADLGSGRPRAVPSVPPPRRATTELRSDTRSDTRAEVRGDSRNEFRSEVRADARPGLAPAQPPAPVHAPPHGPAADGITLLARARRNHPGLRAIVLAAADDPRRAARAFHAGAGGWVAKESSLSRLMAVVRGVLRDETHLPPALLTGVIRELTNARRDRTESERLVDTLTPREKQVLRCMVAGLGRQAVAERLYLSPHTVRTHMQNVLGKLGVHSTLAAVAVARRAGVGPAEPAPITAPPSVASTAAPGVG
ncbi:LuxR C-terminal-related transcriptional regulator [Kitasatospora sp. NPDC050543]|uniref:LuxR C-terminal-related transcriptional regulator n=1 Tax=Kitasatospora sp. NPDC050543 TaxID=3364054 RepID=UPI00379AAFA4